MGKDRFEECHGNGMSQCYNCGCVSWDVFMLNDARFNERVCPECRKLIEQGKPDKAIKWKGFNPRHRDENRK